MHSPLSRYKLVKKFLACVKIIYMPFIWDYDIKELKKTKSGRLLILERMINYGLYPSDKEKIPLKEVKKHWSEFVKGDEEREQCKRVVHMYNYQGGKHRLSLILNLPVDIAQSLMDIYDKLFPEIRLGYQAWIRNELKRLRSQYFLMCRADRNFSSKFYISYRIIRNNYHVIE